MSGTKPNKAWRRVNPTYKSKVAQDGTNSNFWKRPTGKLKSIECRQFLERLDARGIIRLPSYRNQKREYKKIAFPRTRQTDSHATISEKLSELSSISLSRVEAKEQRQLWYEYVDRYHYLGYQKSCQFGPCIGCQNCAG